MTKFSSHAFHSSRYFLLSYLFLDNSPLIMAYRTSLLSIYFIFDFFLSRNPLVHRKRDYSSPFPILLIFPFTERRTSTSSFRRSRKAFVVWRPTNYCCATICYQFSSGIIFIVRYDRADIEPQYYYADGQFREPFTCLELPPFVDFVNRAADNFVREDTKENSFKRDGIGIRGIPNLSNYRCTKNTKDLCEDRSKLQNVFKWLQW